MSDDSGMGLMAIGMGFLDLAIAAGIYLSGVSRSDPQRQRTILLGLVISSLAFFVFGGLLVTGTITR